MAYSWVHSGVSVIQSIPACLALALGHWWVSHRFWWRWWAHLLGLDGIGSAEATGVSCFWSLRGQGARPAEGSSEGQQWQRTTQSKDAFGVLCESLPTSPLLSSYWPVETTWLRPAGTSRVLQGSQQRMRICEDLKNWGCLGNLPVGQHPRNLNRNNWVRIESQISLLLLICCHCWFVLI